MSENGQLKADGRICLHQDLTDHSKFNLDRFGDTPPSIVQAAAIFRHIASFIRYTHSGGTWSPESHLIDDYKVFENEPTDDPRLCIVWNPNTNQIQFAALGMSLWEAEIAAENGATFLKALYINPNSIYEAEYGVANGGADNS
jgi:hypothetical protein